MKSNSSDKTIGSYSCACVFDENLRDVAVDPKSMLAACEYLQTKLLNEQDLNSQVRILTQLGSFHRILNNLHEAENCHIQCIELLNKLAADSVRMVAAKIRLAHVYQWQKRFEVSNQIFLDCLLLAEGLSDNGEMKSFALQHQGKNLFDQKKYDEALKHFYEAMMIRARLKRDDLADSSRLALNRVVSLLFPSPSEERQAEILMKTQTPDFVRLVNGKKHSEIAESGRPSCINAVFSFFAQPYKYDTAQTSDVLEFLKNECEQMEEPKKKEVGNVVVFWSRSGEIWNNKKIIVKEMDPSDPNFPYDLVCRVDFRSMCL